MFVVAPRLVARVGVALAALGAAGYFGWRVYPALRAPMLVLQEPARDAYVAEPELAIHGVTDPGARLTVNRESVYVGGDGRFVQPMRLVSGLNVIELAAEGRFGRKTVLTKYIVLR